MSRDPRLTANGLQIPDSTLKVDHTRLDFSQGTVIQDGVLTHLAISGEGFFYLVEKSSYATGGVAGAQMFLTRDGEFRWSLDDVYNASVGLPLGSTILTDSTGSLLVVGNGLNFEIIRQGTGATFAVTSDTVSGVIATSGSPRIATPNAGNQSLKFSKYGSTIFEGPPGGFYAGVTFINNRSEIIQSALESSNAALNDTLPELSLAQKMFSAVSKIINIHNSNLDITANLIR